jgi:hypothetical protein
MTALVLKHISARLLYVCHTRHNLSDQLADMYCSEFCGPKLKAIETTGSISQEVLDEEKAMLKGWCLYDTEEEV